jgi:hypothetical protein
MTPPHVPITPENCASLPGPFYHGTKARLAVGDLLITGRPTHFEPGSGRALKHVYFSAQMEPAIWGAELAVALSGEEGRGHIYIVEPTSTFEDDPNLTNKRFPGNPTQSYRTTAPLRITGIVESWEGHSDEQVRVMVEGLANLERQGLHVIED